MADETIPPLNQSSISQAIVKSIAPPNRIGPYHILEKIGEGSGVVDLPLGVLARDLDFSFGHRFKDYIQGQLLGAEGSPLKPEVGQRSWRLRPGSRRPEPRSRGG